MALLATLGEFGGLERKHVGETTDVGSGRRSVLGLVRVPAGRAWRLVVDGVGDGGSRRGEKSLWVERRPGMGREGSFLSLGLSVGCSQLLADFHQEHHTVVRS